MTKRTILLLLFMISFVCADQYYTVKGIYTPSTIFHVDAANSNFDSTNVEVNHKWDNIIPGGVGLVLEMEKPARNFTFVGGFQYHLPRVITKEKGQWDFKDNTVGDDSSSSYTNNSVDDGQLEMFSLFSKFRFTFLPDWHPDIKPYYSAKLSLNLINISGESLGSIRSDSLGWGFSIGTIFLEDWDFELCYDAVGFPWQDPAIDFELELSSNSDNLTGTYRYNQIYFSVGYRFPL